jgi:hypothetical protein
MTLSVQHKIDKGNEQADSLVEFKNAGMTLI